MKKILRSIRSVPATRPGFCLACFLIVFVLFWTVQCALQKNILGLDSVESVCWGAKLQPGYFKHPPLAAWIAFFAAKATGWSDWIQYFLDLACTAIGVWFVYLLAKEFFSASRAALSALILFVLHYYVMPRTVFCPNSIMIALQPVMAYFFFRSLKYGRLADWLLFGLFSGLAFLGKYAAGLLLLSMLICMVFHEKWRKKLLSAGPWAALAVFVPIVLPHLIWLYRNDFICLTYVEESTGTETPAYIASYPLFLLGITLYPLLVQFAALTVGCLPRHFRRVRIPVNRDALYFSAMLSAIPVLVLLLVSLTGRHVVATWLSTLASWSGILTVSVFPFALTRRTFRRIFAWLIPVSIAVFASSVISLSAVPREKLHLKPEALAREVNTYLAGKNAGSVPYVFGYRWLANSLEYYLPHHPVSIDRDDAVSKKRFLDEMNRGGVLLIERFPERMLSDIRKDFPRMLPRNFDELSAKERIEIMKQLVYEGCVEFKAPCSRKAKTYYFYMIYLPPGKLREYADVRP